MLVGRIDEVAQPLVDKLLSERAGMHIGIHIDFGHVEALVLEHTLHRDDIRMHLSPAQRFDGCVDDVGTIITYLQDGSHRESRTGVSVILYDDIGMLFLDSLGERAQHCRLTYSRHVLQTDFGRTGRNEFVGDVAIVVNRVYWRRCDTQGSLRRHSCLGSPLDAWDDVSHIVQAAEDTGYIHTLCMLHLVHQLAHVVGHRIHPERIQSTVEHVGLDASFVKRLAEGSNSIVGILTGEQVNLFKCTAIGFYSRKTAHLNNNRRNALQLVLAGLKFSRGLPHISINETKLNFLFHTLISYSNSLQRYAIYHIPPNNFLFLFGN